MATKIARIMDGKSLAQSIHERLLREIKMERLMPSLAILQVGERPDSALYIAQKMKAANQAQITCQKFHFENDVAERDLLRKIESLNGDPTVHGILVQLPLPKHLSESKIVDSISIDKDVDGFTPVNIGRMCAGNDNHFIPCTPKGIIALLEEYEVDFQGKRAVVVGRSNIVGFPTSVLLEKKNATVTLCHRYTENLQQLVAQADILVVAIGKPNFIHGDWIKPGCVVIDVGINYVPDSSKKSGRRLVGDVDFESASQHAKMITPVPGGVGPMTVSMLMSNVVESARRMREREALAMIPNPLKLLDPVPSDIDIAKAQNPLSIREIAENIGILPTELEQYGDYKAKIKLDILKRLEDKQLGKYIIVTGITPTPAGEGKSTATCGLVQALGGHLSRKAIACVRQPSMGPTFGIKGGAAGGGYSQCIPMEEFNLHMTGDIHAITAATNLLVAAIDTRIFHESTQSDKALFSRLVPSKKNVRNFSKYIQRRLQKLGIHKSNPQELTEDEIRRLVRLDIDPESITVNRVVDVNDRFLRKITIGQGAKEKGITRTTQFDISVASECMSILTLASSFHDLRQRLGAMVIGYSKAGEPVTAEDIGIAGAMAALLKDASKPNLMQTIEGTPVLVHAGPFANISVGQSSVVADQIALRLADYCVTEAGFSSEIGLEKFCNIKCRTSGLKPDTAVLVATVQALKMHGDGNLEIGCENMARHIQNVKKFGIPVVVAINKFAADTDVELEIIRKKAIAAGALDAVPATNWSHGGKGAVKLALVVIKACEMPTNFNFLYSSDAKVTEKIDEICRKMYGAKSVSYSPEAQEKIKKLERLGYGNLPICIAKTQYSISANPELKNIPRDFDVPIKDIRLSAGAGFIYPLTQAIETIPGLPMAPAFLNIDVNDEGELFGIY